MINLNEVSYRSIDRILKQSHLRVGCKVSLDMISHHEVIDHTCGELLLTLEAKIYEEDLSIVTKYVEFSYPSSWWQMLKQQYAPSWFIEKFPVTVQTVKKKVDFSFDVMYPDFRPANNMPYQIVREFSNVI